MAKKSKTGRKGKARRRGSGPSFGGPRSVKYKQATPLNPAGIRRVRAFAAIVSYITANAAPAGLVILPADTIKAKSPDGGSFLVTFEDIAQFVERFQKAGKIAQVEKRENAYAFKVAARPAASVKPASLMPPRSPSRVLQTTRPPDTAPLLDAGKIMKEILVSIAKEPKRFGAIMEDVARALKYPLQHRVFTERFKNCASVCIERLIMLGFAQRERKTVSILPKGRSRLEEGKPFVGDELPTKYRPKLVDAEPQNQPDPTGRLSKLLQTISKLPPEKLIALWTNAVKVISDPKRRSEHAGARQVVEAVENAWDALDRKEDEEFAWPTTDVKPGSGASAGNLEFRSEGMLSYLEYRVGKTAGLSAAVRQSILSRVFEGKLPRVFDADYMRSWGAPGSALRLKKMAESLAAFARNAKRADEDRMEEAIRQWEQDLEFLYERYYVGRFGFGWPSTSISVPPRFMGRK